MLRKIVLGVMLIGVALIMWNEYRLWSNRSEATMRRWQQKRPMEPPSPSDVAADAPVPGESPIHLIELCLRPTQSPEPLWADSEEPALLPWAKSESESRTSPILPARFDRLAESTPPPSATIWQWHNVGPWLIPMPTFRPLHFVPADPGSIEPEVLFVLPRPIDNPNR